MSLLSHINSSVGAPNGHGFVSMHRGYLMVIFSNDGGGGKGSGGFAFLDISNPEAPQKIFSTQDSPVYTSSASAHYAGDFAESHGYSMGGDILCMTYNAPSSGGVEFWDLSDPASPTGPRRLSKLPLSTLTGGDYAGKAWWVTWQGRYAYVAGSDAGLFIVDALNPEAPVEAKRIPTGQLGGFSIHTCIAVGNLLILTRAEESNVNPGLTIMDIGDPLNPKLLFTDATLDMGYSVMVNGERILVADDPISVYEMSDPTAPTLLGIGQDVSTKGGYGMAQDEFFVLGSSNHALKVDLSQRDLADKFIATGKIRPPVPNADWDFAVPLGNLIFAGNDHGDGSALLVSQTAPDTTPPAVNMVSPESNSVNQHTLSRIGLTFTDQIDSASINTSTITVRRLGGEALSGIFTTQTGMVNFHPSEPLEENTTYEISVPAGGIKDYSGNALQTSFLSYFSTGDDIIRLELEATSPGPLEINKSGTFIASSSGTTSTLYSWDFGDGTPPTSPSTSPIVSHTFSKPGNYTVQLSANDEGVTDRISFVQTAHRPLTEFAPTHSSSIVYDEENGYVWSVNPDNDTVTAINLQTLTKSLEIPVGKTPRTLALGPNNTLLVTGKGDSTLHVINRVTGNLQETIELPYGSQPFGVVFSPSKDAAYVSLEATGQILKLDPSNLEVLDTLPVGPTPRGLAITGKGEYLFVTRFISPESEGQVACIDLEGFTFEETVSLRIDPGPDDEDTGRGLPNYVSTIAINPDGSEAWVPSKKDNIERGLGRDGLPLNFESTVRSIVSQIDLNSETPAEITAKRHDFNDRGMASSVVFSPLGNLAFVTTQGTSTVEVMDAYTGILRSGFDTGGLAPQGLAISPDGSRLFVQNFMSRSVTVFSVGNLCANSCSSTTHLAEIETVSTESLPDVVLRGKQLFYDASDPRINQDSYISCAACHLDGGQDGRIWDFTDRGEGLRNTTSLDGRAGTGHGRVHWSANFDEIQDFEHDIRNAFGGSGLMDNDDYFSGKRDIPLGGPKAGFSPDLDALAAYLTSLQSTPPSPYRKSDGEMTVSGLAGATIFEARCSSCHGGEGFTDSSLKRVHDVGTLKSSSGNRLGKTLAGIDTPGLRGVWATAPYFHDGSAPTLLDVLTTHNPNDKHGVTSDLSPTEVSNLLDYLLQLDDSTPAHPLVGTFISDSEEDGMPDSYEELYGLDPYLDDSEIDSDEDFSNNLHEYTRGTDPLNEDSDNDGLLDGVETKTSIYLTIKMTGTDPLNADSDRDGVQDGVEVSLSTDPNNPSHFPPDSRLALLDDFESHTLSEPITHAAHWVGASSLTVVVDPEGNSGKVGSTVGANGPYLLAAALNDLAIEEGSIATLHFRIRASSLGPDFHLGLSEAVDDQNFNDYYYQMGFKNGTIVARDGGATERIVGQYETDTWYKIWLVANTGFNQFDLYIEGGNFVKQTLIADNFKQRKTGNTDINAFRILTSGSQSSADTIWLDDIYISPKLENLADPTSYLTLPLVQSISIGSSITEIELSNLNPNYYYTLERTQDLSDPWQVVFSDYKPVFGSETFQDLNPPTGPVYYRVKVQID
jgi:YVTN family beta-propeller protein